MSLKKHEDRIHRSFAEAGDALRIIRDERLYKSEESEKLNGQRFKTFESYCQTVWGFSRQHASYLIKSAAVIENLSTTVDKPAQLPTNERQTRELAKLPAEEQAEAWEEVCETTDNPTAKDVKRVVEKRKAGNYTKTAEPPDLLEEFRTCIIVPECGSPDFEPMLACPHCGHALGPAYQSLGLEPNKNHQTR